MQKVTSRPSLTRSQSILILVVIIIAIAALVYGGIKIFSKENTNEVVAYRLPCDYNDSICAFGSNVLYYDGESIHCMSYSGSVRWSFQIGANAGFSCNSDTIVAWVGNTIYIIDQNGNSTYNDNLGDEIQFARVGTQYIAAIIGDNTSPRLVVKDHLGSHMDEEADAYSGLILLDVGFYGDSGQYMWTLALDVYSTAANTIINTFEVGKLNTGEVSLGSAITYAVLYENSILRVINTRQMLSFNYKGTEDETARVLVYGWKFIKSETSQRGNALMLFAPTAQTDSSYDIRELRLISGDNIDKRYTIPDSCIGATLWNRNIYALSATNLYCASTNESRFTTYELPLESSPDLFIDTLDNGYIIVSCSSEVYVCSLPQNAN